MKARQHVLRIGVAVEGERLSQQLRDEQAEERGFKCDYNAGNGKTKECKSCQESQAMRPTQQQPAPTFCSTFTRGTKVVHRLSGPEHPPVRQKLELHALLDAHLYFLPPFSLFLPSFAFICKIVHKMQELIFCKCDRV